MIRDGHVSLIKGAKVALQLPMYQDENRPLPTVVDRSTFHEQLEALRAREKAHTREGDAIAAGRRRLPMVEVAADSPLLGPHGPVTLLDAFEGRRQLIAYYFMWWPGRAAAEQCEGCTSVTSHVGELAYLHSRDITFAVLCQGRNTAYGPGDAQTSYDESLRYRTFMGWDMPWYSAQRSLDSLLGSREHGLFHLVCYLRDGNEVFETYWTKRRGAEVLDYNYALMDLTVFGRQEDWEDSPVGWPRRGHATRTWAGSRVAAHGSGRAVVLPRNGHGSKPGTRTIWERRTRVQRSLRIIATDGSCRRRRRPDTGPGAVFSSSRGSGAGRRQLPYRPSLSKASRRMRTLLGRACCPPPTTIGLRTRRHSSINPARNARAASSAPPTVRSHLAEPFICRIMSGSKVASVLVFTVDTVSKVPENATLSAARCIR